MERFVRESPHTRRERLGGRRHEDSGLQRDLVIRARAGDHDAFSALAASSIGHLLAAARLILRDEGAAEDAVQDALVDAWLDIRGLRDPDRFDAWLHRLLLRGCYRAAKRNRGRQRVEVQLLPMDGPRTPDAEDALVARDQLDRGFRRLPTDQRAVLVLHHYLDMTDSEAADVLDIPVGTFKSRLSRANEALRAAVDADERRAGLGRESIA
jgi:RNA polymerase sigma-70 factor (ECF subfamily)